MSAKMAPAKHCSICEKNPGTCVCTGCQATFCRKHFNDHHTTLFKELDGLLGDRSYLQDQINKADHHNDSRSQILLQIDEWQRATIKKVTEAAEQARQQVVKLLSSRQVEIRTRFRQLSDELDCLKEREDLVEQDLTRQKEMIRALKQDLEQLPETSSIKLHTEQSDQITWSRLIYAEDNSDNTGKKQDQQLLTSKLIIKFTCGNTDASFLTLKTCYTLSLYTMTTSCSWTENITPNYERSNKKRDISVEY